MQSIGIFVGDHTCNAHCAHCSGERHRLPMLATVNIYQLLLEAYKQGARKITLSGSGEPTCRPDLVTSALRQIAHLRDRGVTFERVRLYSNGIHIGEHRLLPSLRHWRAMGLTEVRLSLHGLSPVENAAVYGVENYPELEAIVTELQAACLRPSAQLLLSGRRIGTAKRCIEAIEALVALGVEEIALRLIRDEHDEVHAGHVVDVRELQKILRWAQTHPRGACVRCKFSHDVYDESGVKALFRQDGTKIPSWSS